MWKKVELSDLWNLLIWYAWAKVWVPLKDINDATFFVTLKSRSSYQTHLMTKYSQNKYIKALQNELADRVVYKAWYKMWLETKNWKITMDVIIDYLYPAVNIRRKIDNTFDNN